MNMREKKKHWGLSMECRCTAGCDGECSDERETWKQYRTPILTTQEQAANVMLIESAMKKAESDFRDTGRNFYRNPV